MSLFAYAAQRETSIVGASSQTRWSAIDRETTAWGSHGGLGDFGWHLLRVCINGKMNCVSTCFGHLRGQKVSFTEILMKTNAAKTKKKWLKGSHTFLSIKF